MGIIVIKLQLKIYKIYIYADDVVYYDSSPILCDTVSVQYI